MYLHEKNQQIETLRGVGNRKASSLRRLGIDTVRELLLYFPRDYLDRTRIVTLAAAPVERQATCLVRILSHEHTRLRRESILKVYVKDESANATLMCFGRSFLQYTLLPGKMFLINGVFQHSPRGGLQCSNFEFEEHSPVTEDYEKILPIYGLTSGLSQKVIRGSIREGLKTLGEQIGEELPGELRRRRRLADYSSALKNIHFPADWNAMQEARRYFIYHELFYLILTMKLRRSRRMQSRKRRMSIAFNLRDGLLSRLPFELTTDQKQVLSEIERDLFSPLPMARLIQGDVGCGKTLVALLAALSVIEAGEQAACMVPTELLARQHGDNAARFLEPLGVRVALLVGSRGSESRGSESRGSESRGKRQRALLLQALREGEIDLLIGTHALFSEDVRFHALGLAIIDEQHRFGVRQRFSLIGKGETPDLLMMSATPIPRSLALTAFGDLDISTIRTMPSGRKPVITHLARMGNEGKVYERVRREIHGGKQAYFVYPLISETEKSSRTPDDLKNAERMTQVLLTRVFPDFRLALIHSRIDEGEKRRTMENFSAGKLDILVATSVVEVGVDVRNATCMVIEHAERFGLSSLHQLRGRVGRGESQSYTFLIYGRNLTDNGKKRLRIMKETTDGFRISEEDLEIRGPGELLGLQQSGFFRLRIADLSRDTDILLEALEDVTSLLESDPELLKGENRMVGEIAPVSPSITEEPFQAG